MSIKKVELECESAMELAAIADSMSSELTVIAKSMAELNWLSHLFIYTLGYAKESEVVKRLNSIRDTFSEYTEAYFRSCYAYIEPEELTLDNYQQIVKMVKEAFIRNGCI